MCAPLIASNISSQLSEGIELIHWLLVELFYVDLRLFSPSKSRVRSVDTYYNCTECGIVRS